MIRLGDFLCKQGRFLLENDNQALIYIAILAVIPFAGWLSAAAMALITLRKGWYEGFKGLLAGFLALLVLSLMTMTFSAALITSAMAFLPCYLAAVILHLSASWKVASGFIVLLALMIIVLVHWFVPDFIVSQYQYIQAIIKEFERQGSGSDSLSMIASQGKLNEGIIANYIVGIQSVSVVLSAIMSLLLARSIQSRLFYPGGFRQEMLGFRISGFGIILLVLVLVGAYQQNLLAISCLPILITYYVLAGLSLTFNALARKQGLGSLVLLIVPVILVPFVMLPIYVFLGALDSLFNIRLYGSTKSNDKENKG